ncbi:MAG: hypothetical protein AAF571_03375 [Verrucomicrobiota bacterium]
MKLLNDIITEHGSAAILKERLLLLKDQIEALEQKVVDLQTENTELKGKVYDLTKKLEEAAPPDEYFKHKGILLRKGEDGKTEDTVYCPKCQSPMYSLMDATPFKCSCGFIAGFTGKEFRKILRELNS